MTKFMINNRTDAWKTDVNLLNLQVSKLMYYFYLLFLFGINKCCCCCCCCCCYQHVRRLCSTIINYSEICVFWDKKNVQCASWAAGKNLGHIDNSLHLEENMLGRGQRTNHPSLFSRQMEAIVLTILQISFFATSADLKIEDYHLDIIQF